MISIVLAGAIAVGTLMIITIIVTLMTGSVFAAGAVVALIVLAVAVLKYYDFISFEISGNEIDIFVRDIFAVATASPPAEKIPEKLYRPLKGKEVYHVGDDRFTYEEAPAVCAAYGGELATQEQVEDAFNSGGEWCGYGWSAGGLALFPTQRATWEILQREIDPKKRTSCGRPGVNGGYFDPTLKFGVNCYGQKPKGTLPLPLAPPGRDTAAFNAMVAKFKKQIGDFFMNPFNRTTWSNQPDIDEYGSQFKQDIGKLDQVISDTVGPQYTFQAVQKTVSAAAGPAEATTKAAPAPAAMAQAQNDPQQQMMLQAMKARMGV